LGKCSFISQLRLALTPYILIVARRRPMKVY
jgi:hypothetical protein